MSPTLALLLGAILVYCALRWDRRTHPDATGLFWPTLWYLVVASRPIGVWLYIWGFHFMGGSNDPTDGSSIDRYFFAALTAIGVWILHKRGFRWTALFRAHPWLAALFAYMALSILWSHYPFVSLKRYVKVIGSLGMALVVLTNERPFEAILTVLRRCLYVHLPMSIVCVKYFRELGVSFDWSGHAQYWQGISTSKNTLGQIAMIGVLVFFWETRRAWPQRKWKTMYVPYLLMALYLLKGSEDSISLTSVAVCAFAVFVFVVIQGLRRNLRSVQRFISFAFLGTVALVTLILTHSVVMFSPDSFFGRVITAFGRDITLTDRTNIWHDVYAAASGNPLLGVGYGGFWIGRLANIPWNADMTWVLGEAHSGYIDTYLQLGWIGGFLLAGVLFSTLPKLLPGLAEDFDCACFRITLFLTILFVNITESTFLRGDHQLWFVMQLVLWVVPAAALARNTVASAEPATPAPGTARVPEPEPQPVGFARA